MEHIGIDLGGRESQLCIRNASGEIVQERRLPTRELPAFLRERPTCRVILETCAEAFAIADAAFETGHQVRVVPCSLVRALGVGARGVKNDRRDAQVLSEASCRMDLPSVHVPSVVARERKSMCGMREALVGARTKLVNTVRGWLRTQNIRIASGDLSTFCKRVRVRFDGTTIPAFVMRQLTAIEALADQISAADLELEELADKDPICHRLMSVPGVGPVTAVRYTAALDIVERFGSAHEVESYLGLVPGEDSSSDRKRKTSITKAGATRLRWALGQAAWSARRTRKHDPMVQWSVEIEKRRGKRIAVIALARKLAGILYAIWRDGTIYQANQGARPQELVAA